MNQISNNAKAIRETNKNLFQVKYYQNIVFNLWDDFRWQDSNFFNEPGIINRPDLIYHNITVFIQVGCTLFQMNS